MIPDKSEAPFDDITVRQALNYALDRETIAAGAYGNPDFYCMDGTLFDPEQVELYSSNGTEAYQAYDLEKAKSLLQESSYDGRTLKLIYPNNNAQPMKARFSYRFP